MQTLPKFVLAVIPLAALSACTSMGTARVAAPDVPTAVAVPAGHTPTMILTGSGLLTYECRAKASTTDVYEWTFVAPDAVLRDRSGAQVGKYYGGPTWEHGDGSKITGKQLAVAPSSAGNIPYQLVQVTPSPGSGTFNSTSYIQRVNTKGGVAPNEPCTASTAGSKKTVDYSADYVFYRP